MVYHLSKKRESLLDNYLLIGTIIISLCTLGVLVYKMMQGMQKKKVEKYQAEGYGMFEDAGRAIDQGLEKLGKMSERELRKLQAEAGKAVSKGKSWLREQREKKEIEKILKELQ